MKHLILLSLFLAVPLLPAQEKAEPGKADKKAKRAARPNTDPPTKPPLTPAKITDFPGDTDTLEIYLLMGQSNMKGRGRMPENPLSDPTILMMHKPSDGWFLARHPLHLTGDAKTFEGHDNAAVGPGLSFAQALRKARPKVRIALIPTAVGGTRVAAWQKGQRLYEEAVSKAKLAMSQAPEGKARIAGALWLQGEADTRPERAEVYPDKLTAMIDALRADLAIPDLPFIAATIGEFKQPPEGPAAINDILLGLPELRPHTACVNGREFEGGHIGDSVHLDTATQEEIGRRFAKHLLAIEKR